MPGRKTTLDHPHLLLGRVPRVMGQHVPVGAATAWSVTGRAVVLSFHYKRNVLGLAGGSNLKWRSPK